MSRTTQDQDVIGRTAKEMDGLQLYDGGLQPEHDVKVGDRVRSYDFPQNFKAYAAGSREPCYVEGTVTAIVDHPRQPCKAYLIEGERRVWYGEEVEFDGDAERETVAPVNGTRNAWGGLTFGVVKVDA